MSRSTLLLWMLPALGAIACSNRDPVKLGIVLGPDGAEGARLAAETVNQSGGIRGRALDLVILEGSYGTSARAALTAADRLAKDKSVVAVVGHSNSSASIAASQVYNDARIVQIAPTSSSPKYSAAGPYSFRLIASDVHQGPFLAREALRQQTRPRIAVVYVNDDYGRGLRNQVMASLKRAGVSPVYEGAYLDGVGFPNAQPVIASIERARPTLMLWLGRGTELIRLLDSARSRLASIPIIGGDGVGSICCATDPLTLERVRYARLVDPDLPSEPLAQLAARYHQRTGLEITDQAALSFEAVMLLAEVMRSGAMDREAIRKALASHDGRNVYHGATGTYWFDENGDAPPRYYLDNIRVRSTARAGAGAGNTR